VEVGAISISAIKSALFSDAHRLIIVNARYPLGALAFLLSRGAEAYVEST
jgi:hypothetical protein